MTPDTHPELVRFELPDYVSPANDAFNRMPASATYNSHFGGSVTVNGTAEYHPGEYPDHCPHLVVDGRKIRSDRNVFSAATGRHVGTVETITVNAEHDTAVAVVANGMNHDVDIGPRDTVVQAWDHSVIETQGWIAGTVSVTLRHVNP